MRAVKLDGHENEKSGESIAVFGRNGNEEIKLSFKFLTSLKSFRIRNQTMAIDNKDEIQKSIEEIIGCIQPPDCGEVFEELEDFMMGGSIPGLLTGFEDLDRLIGGLQKGRLYMLGGRSSMGSSALLLNILNSVSVKGEKNALLFSTQGFRKDVTRRLVSMNSNFSFHSINKGYKPNKASLQALQEASKLISKTNLIMYNETDLSIEQIREASLEWSSRSKADLDLIAIDVVQDVRSFSQQSIGSRDREIAEVSRGLKALSRELNIPVIAVSHLNREPDKRGGMPRPCGQIEILDFIRESDTLPL